MSEGQRSWAANRVGEEKGHFPAPYSSRYCLYFLLPYFFIPPNSHSIPVMDWMFVTPQNSYVETLPPSVMVLGGGIWER